MYVVVRCKNREEYDKVYADLIERGEDIYAFGEVADEDDVSFSGSHCFLGSEELFSNENEEENDFCSVTSSQSLTGLENDESSISHDLLTNGSNIFIKDEPLDSDEGQCSSEQKSSATPHLPSADGGVSALSLLGDDDDDDDDVDVDDEEGNSFLIAQEFPKEAISPNSPILPRKTSFNHQIKYITLPEKTDAVPLGNGSFYQRCRLCSENVTFKSKSEWSQKCHHAFYHSQGLSYECPYCGLSHHQRPIICRHLKVTHNQGFQPVCHPACLDDEGKNRILEAVEQCFPSTRLEPLDVPKDPQGYSPAVRSVMYYYVHWQQTTSNKTRKSVPVAMRVYRNKCTKCKNCISKGPLEDKLKFEHALGHSFLKWIMCSKCPDSFTDKESFYSHSREKHSGRAQLICKDREDFSPIDQQIVETLVAKFFPVELDDKKDDEIVVKKRPIRLSHLQSIEPETSNSQLDRLRVGFTATVGLPDILPQLPAEKIQELSENMTSVAETTAVHEEMNALGAEIKEEILDEDYKLSRRELPARRGTKRRNISET